MRLKRPLILSFFALLASCSNKQSNSPAILVASYNSGPGAAIFTFRQDKTCEWIAGIGDSPHEGHYQLNDSLIQVSGIDFGSALKSNRLLLTHKNPNNSELTDPIIVQLDNHGSVADSTFIFRITMDKRQR
jgi:hypothetical protein